MAKTIFEEMGGTYMRQGDYLLPCLSLPAEKVIIPGFFEPPVRILRAAIPENESHAFR